MSEETLQTSAENEPEAIEEAAVESVAEQAANAEPEPAAEPEEPAVPEVTRQRQWVTLRGTSMDLRVGAGLVETISNDLASAVGKPHAALIAAAPDTPADVVETLRRGLTDKGFAVSVVDLPDGEDAYPFAAVQGVYASLAEAGITSDDLVVALGHEGALSLASAACAHWCGQVLVGLIPLDYASAVTAATTPRPLDVPGHARMVAYPGSARFEICDVDLLDALSTEDDVLLCRAHMVATAMADSAKAFEKLWDAADDIVAHDRNRIAEFLATTVKGRGKIVASSSVAIRQSIDYGQSLRRALREVVSPDVPESTLLAEALRFAARLAAAGETLSIDDMFTQDELLERFGLGTVACEVDADALLAAIEAERYARTNRFMLALPRALGRVRLSAVNPETLDEHVRVWCATR